MDLQEAGEGIARAVGDTIEQQVEGSAAFEAMQTEESIADQIDE